MDEEDETRLEARQVSKPARGPSIQPGSYRYMASVSSPSDEGFRGNLPQKPQGGRPLGPTPGSYRDIEERTGIPQPTIRRVEQHVAAIESHPEIAEAPQKVALADEEALKEITCAESVQVFEEEAWGFSCRPCTKLQSGLPSKPGSYWASSTRARMLAFPSNRAEQHVPRPDQCLDCHQDHTQFVGWLSGPVGSLNSLPCTVCRAVGRVGS